MGYDHADNCYAGNFSSNLIVKSASTTKRSFVLFSHSTTSSTRVVTDVCFETLGTNATYTGGVTINGSNSTSSITPWDRFSNNCFYDNRADCGLIVYNNTKAITIENNIHYSANAASKYAERYQGGSSDAQTPANSIVFRHGNGIYGQITGLRLVSPVVSGVVDGITVSGSYMEWTSPSVFSCQNAIQAAAGGVDISSGAIGTEFSAATVSTVLTFSTALFRFSAENMGLQSSGTLNSSLTSAPTGSAAEFINKGGDIAEQAIYKPQYNTIRSNATNKRSTSSISLVPLSTGVTCQRQKRIAIAAGETVRIVGYCQYSGGTWTSITASLSGTIAGTALTTDTYTATAGASGAFEQINQGGDDFLSITNSTGSDGEVALTLACVASATGGTVYFDGIPDAPFVTKARHYGYVFDQTTANATENPSLSLAVTTEAAALLLGDTEITITGATSAVALNASRTFQQLWEYSQAWACTTANLGYSVPISGTGAQTSPILTPAGNITTTGYTLNGGGSLAMGGKTLTASAPWSYTYTGGTFSQAASVPSFSGGTLNIGAAGTYTYAQAAEMILSMTPTTPGTYALGDTTFTGQVDLRNTSGSHAITVELPTGTSYTTANNTGATITVTLPVVTADISITGMANTGGANNRLQVINSSAVAAADWQAATVYASGDVVLRTSGVGSENTAGLYMRCTSGGTSHATTEPTWDTTVGNTTADNSVTWTTYSVLYYDADPAGTSLTDTYIDGEEFLAGETIEVRFAEEDPGITFKTYSTSVVATADGFSALVNETADDVYATYALSGAAYEATFSPNYVANYIVLDANTDFSGKAAYAYYCYLLTTSSGMYRFWGGLTGIDAGNIRNNVGTISLYFDESAGFVKQTDDVRIFRSDNTRPAIDPTTGGSGIEINWRVPVNVVSIATASVLSPSESAQLMALPSASANATAVLSAATSAPIAADVKKMNAETVIGTGVEGDLWRGGV